MEISIKDNSKIKRNDTIYSDLSNFDEWTNKTLAQLESEGLFIVPNAVNKSKDLDGQLYVLQKDGKQYETSNIMGLISSNGIQLRIESRFSSGNEDYFFQYLLHKVLDIPNVVIEQVMGANNYDLNLFILMFPFYLKKAMRKGIYRVYKGKNYNDLNVRGTINIDSSFIKKNTPFLGKISYTTHDLSEDNYLNELIRHTLEFIKQQDIGCYVISTIRTAVKQITEITTDYNRQDRQKVIDTNRQKTIRHAYFTEYRKLQLLCLRILNYENVNISQGNIGTNGILFDGAWLWEEYISQLISDDFYHPQNRERKSVQYLFSRHTDRRNNERDLMQTIYPDFISNNLRKMVIADTKYKPQENMGRNDYFQMLSYMFRFNSKRGIFIYPESVKVNQQVKNHRKFYLLNGVKISTVNNLSIRQDTTIEKLGLIIPQDVSSYEDFCLQIHKSEERLKLQIMAN